jgi:dynein heavy chain
VLFRPVAMVVPDYQLVAEVMLFSEGFDAAPWLAGKMVHLYKLASEQLSQQVRLLCLCALCRMNLW